MDNTFSLPQDLAGCQRLIEEQARVIADLQSSRERLQQSNDTLQLTLDKLLRQIYGRRGERFIEDPTQKKLDFGDDPQTEDAFRDALAEARQVLDEVQTRRKAKRPGRRAAPRSSPTI